MILQPADGRSTHHELRKLGVQLLLVGHGGRGGEGLEGEAPGSVGHAVRDLGGLVPAGEAAAPAAPAAPAGHAFAGHAAKKKQDEKVKKKGVGEAKFARGALLGVLQSKIRAWISFGLVHPCFGCV